LCWSFGARGSGNFADIIDFLLRNSGRQEKARQEKDSLEEDECGKKSEAPIFVE
jgi:hypothetical protein